MTKANVVSGNRVRTDRQESVCIGRVELRRLATHLAASIHREARCQFVGLDDPEPPRGRIRPGGLPDVLTRTRTPGAKANVAMDCPALRRLGLSVVSYDGDWRQLDPQQVDAAEAKQSIVGRGFCGVANGPRVSVDHEPCEGNKDAGVARIHVPLFTAEKTLLVSGKWYTQVVCLAHEHVLATSLSAVRTGLEALGEVVNNDTFPSGPAAGRLIAGAFSGRDANLAAPVATSLVLEQRFIPCTDQQVKMTS